MISMHACLCSQFFRNGCAFSVHPEAERRTLQRQQVNCSLLSKVTFARFTSVSVLPDPEVQIRLQLSFTQNATG